jgi:acyl transferase domain-containing protein
VGSLTDGKALWRLARLQADLITEVPPTRWHLPSRQVGAAPCFLGRPAHTAQAGREALRVRQGGFVRRSAMFDNAHFDVSPAEAAAMDPQQRLLLERGYEALHAASLRRESLHGSAVGVHVGLASREFEAISAGGTAGAGRSAFSATGGAPSVASGRLAFVLGLHGSAVTYDTACSSALVAAHGALLSRAAEAAHPFAAGAPPALVAAVHLMLLPATGAAYAIAGMTSMVGRCRTFDARADGYARAEACCAVTVGSSPAGARGHTDGGPASSLFARLHSACVRQDGRSASLTAPNGTAQRSLLTATLSLADLGGATSAGLRGDASGDGWAVTACEAHGTGTPLGDAVEASALAEGTGAAAYIAPEASAPGGRASAPCSTTSAASKRPGATCRRRPP